MSAQKLAETLKDSRLAVRDKAIEALIQKGETAVLPIKNTVLKSVDPEIRAAGIFALYRIGTANSIKEARSGLYDANPVVRTSAARVMGLAKNKESVSKLMELIRTDTAPVRRQAATALGQIGDKTAVQALLNASASNKDRFVEHALIYSLISLKSSVSLTEALKNPSLNIRKTALIALDQMEGSVLKKDDLVPFLNSKDEQLRKTGIWVASHHQDWSDVVISFLRNRLSNPSLSDSDIAAVRDLMITFSQNKEMQSFMTEQLQNNTKNPDRQMFLIDVITHSAVREVPSEWVQQLSNMLDNGNMEIRSQVLGLIESRRIRALNEKLKSIAQDPEMSADFRLKALSSKLLSEPKLSEQEFQLVFAYLDKKYESPLRQTAARLLAAADLSDTQLVKLAKGQLPQVEAFLLPNLVSAFEGNSNEDVGEALVAALGSSSDRLENIAEQDLQNLLSKYPAKVKNAGTPLLETLRRKNEARLSELQALEAKLKTGDVANGAKIFFGKGICGSCHAVANKGADFGPDLTNIGQIRSGHDILEAILYPGASFAREYETSRINTKTGTYTGVIKEQFPEAIIISTGPGLKVRVPRSEITRIEPVNISMMPPGLDKQLSVDELSDLMAYLNSLPDGLGTIRKKN